MQTVQSLLQLHREAHSCLEVLFAHCRQFSAEDLTREFAGFGYPSLRSQLEHLIECEDTWAAELRTPDGGALPFVWTADEPHETVEQLDAIRLRVEESTAAYIRDLGDKRLNEPLTLRVPEKDLDSSEVRTPAFILLHAITHHFHHKGQAVAICRLLGRPTPDTDIQRVEAK